MNKQYEPGTVAAITLTGGALIGRALRTSDRGWRVPSCGDFYYDREVAKVRPLVVLDLAGWDALDLIEALRADHRVGPDWVADQIEQQTRPPKPAEPTGLGAVVEDTEGRKYVRQVDGWWRGEEPCSVNWPVVAAVRVLSEGVEVLSEGVTDD